MDGQLSERKTVCLLVGHNWLWLLIDNKCTPKIINLQEILGMYSFLTTFSRFCLANSEKSSYFASSIKLDRQV
jgi:hypothetical protein